jgi:hypothetical protein
VPARLPTHAANLPYSPSYQNKAQTKTKHASLLYFYTAIRSTINKQHPTYSPTYSPTNQGPPVQPRSIKTARRRHRTVTEHEALHRRHVAGPHPRMCTGQEESRIARCADGRCGGSVYTYVRNKRASGTFVCATQDVAYVESRVESSEVK